MARCKCMCGQKTKSGNAYVEGHLQKVVSPLKKRLRRLRSYSKSVNALCTITVADLRELLVDGINFVRSRIVERIDAREGFVPGNLKLRGEDAVDVAARQRSREKRGPLHQRPYGSPG